MNNQERELPIAFLGKELGFPPLDKASEEGLLAIGGDLSAERLMCAYRSGIFPWFNDDALILWWSPDPRMVLFPQKIRVSKSMQKIISYGQLKLTKNTDFEAVIDHCASIERKDHPGTWITPNMKKAYIELYRKGHVQSYEVWREDMLVGGLYGVDLGHVFCGESMFSLVPNASKFALIRLADELAQKNYVMIDCQVPTPHLKSMGAEEISRNVFVDLLKRKV